MTWKPPNMVIFLSDDLGYNDLSCYVPNRHHTPNIDRLAGEGIRFTDFHSKAVIVFRRSAVGPAGFPAAGSVVKPL